MRELRAAQQVPLAKYAIPRVRAYTEVRHEQNSMSASVQGVAWEFPEMQRMDIQDGRFFSYGEDRRGHTVCVLGWEIANNLFEDEVPIGKWVKIGVASFQVVGVLKHQGQSLTMGTVDDNVFVPFNAFIHNFNWRYGFTILILARYADKVEELREELRSAIRAARNLKPWQEDNFAINSQDMLLEEYNKTTRVLWSAILAIAGLSLLVGGIGVMNIMLITVTERTREIGVRKALGATRSHILWQFLLEAVAQCWLGGSLGFVAGIALPFIVSRIVPQLPFALSWTAVAVAIGFTSFVGITFGLYPAMKAAKLSPVDALRYE